MSTNTLQKNGNTRPGLTFLGPEQILMIDEALAALGDFGEIRLVVERGQLRFVITEKSVDALKWQPGSFRKAA